MKKVYDTRIRLIWVITLIFGLIPFHLWAQSKTGTTIGQFLLIEPSARYAAMGNAGVASFDEISAAYYNAAAIGRLSGYGFQFSHSLWLADIKYNYATVLAQIGDLGNLFFNVTALNSGEIDVRTVEQPLGTGERYTVSNIALGIGYGRKLTDRFSMGIQVNYIQETIWHTSMSTVAINVGTLFDLVPNGLRLGASISNYGLPGSYSGLDLRITYDQDPDRFGDNSSLPGQAHTGEYPLPVIFRVGLTWPYRITNNHQLQIAVNAFHPNDNTESVSFGAEWLMMKTLALRAGYQNLFLKDSEVGLTLGAGLQVHMGGYLFNLDYAWADHGRLQNTQRFSAGFIF
jgi:putative salt-induced outer membrane protein YdiY